MTTPKRREVSHGSPAVGGGIVYSSPNSTRLLPASRLRGCSVRGRNGVDDKHDDEQSLPATWQQQPLAPLAPKSIAVVGTGSAGLAAVKAILDLPLDIRTGWEIVAYERTRDVGGVWLQEPNGPPSPPELPDTPLYPRLHTNTPVPDMTYPGFPYPPLTPLFPPHEYVQRYHAAYADAHGVREHIRFNHTVIAADWIGTADAGHWDLTVRDENEGALKRSRVDHLIVATGHNHYPRVPQWNGTSEWLAHTPCGKPSRSIIHSIYYREPEKYAGRSVLVVGGGASGRDAAGQIVLYANHVYQSLKPGQVPTAEGITLLPVISHFTEDEIVFVDGTSISSIDSVILATGYEIHIPFLSSPHSSTLLEIPPPTRENATDETPAYGEAGLTVNTRYIRPLYEEIFSLSPDHPPTALAFVGLPVPIANCPSDFAQSLLISHAIADSSVLPSRETMLRALEKHEERIRAVGINPYWQGHRFVDLIEDGQDYQDRLVEYLKAKGKLEQDGTPYVEKWRRWIREEGVDIRAAWSKVEELGEQDTWLKGVRTEDEWVDLLKRLVDWYSEENSDERVT
ncbi:FAD/NAD(P)-binding domain-containing protein [Punctularia strigosozonata HHB-11173 SS5]|uniref:FAD/NAD(P)-binding domain-containing protein n=1 Tax=Punctularia strigosozonata (strain HHB-11173) TaxID=741275 RepID=UPI000441730A|nr:FAD/NAD(P)-binding domain-containing protein [Punctularia strigosozonata HHB-11173 SS5]EIN07122.1 FAD/NAD(P)-binding domain-containing protein [Punctularia strigosozonata HHB-11173 SS5]